MAREKKVSEEARLIENFARAGVIIPARIASRLVTLANVHNRIQVKYCNESLNETDEKLLERVTGEIKTAAKILGIKAHFDGDPRGFTVKLHALTGDVYNTWGGAEVGYGIGEGQ